MKGAVPLSPFTTSNDTFGSGMKRTFDVTLCLLFLPAVTLLTLPFALLVFFQDRRWPLYRGERIGRSGSRFGLFKLRSMIVGADLAGIDAIAADDPRITTFGRWLRRTKIDELPQVWNVLIGDMSLVGHRPTCQREFAMYSAEEQRIFEMRPGLTGIATIIFSDAQELLRQTEDSDLSYHQLLRPWKSRFSLLYLEHQSLWLDLEIVLLTVLVLIHRPLALSGVTSLLRRLKADPQLIEIARRQSPLRPYPPPGLLDIVRAVPGKSLAAA